MNRLKDLTAIGIGDIVGTGITAAFWFYLASVMNPEEYGEIHYFLGITAISSVIVLFGTQNTIAVYVAKNIKIQSTFFVISLLASLVGFFVIALIFFRVDVGFLLFAYVINDLSIGYILGKKVFGLYTKYILIQKTLTLTLGISFYFLFGTEGIIFALAISYVVFIFEIYKGFKESKINLELLRPRLGFITNNYVMVMIGTFSSQIDKIIIAPILGFALLGSYSLALQVITVMMMFSTIIFKYLLPNDATGVQNRNIRIIAILVAILVTFLGMILSPIIIPELFPKYSEAVEAIQIMSLGVVPGTINMLLISKFLGQEKSKFVLISSLISLITITSGTITLGIMFETKGIATAYVLSLLFSSIFLICTNKFSKS